MSGPGVLGASAASAGRIASAGAASLGGPPSSTPDPAAPPLPPLPLAPPTPLVVAAVVAAPPEPAAEVVVAPPADPEAPPALVLAAPPGAPEGPSLPEQPMAATHKRAASPRPRNAYTPGPGRQNLMVYRKTFGLREMAQQKAAKHLVRPFEQAQTTLVCRVASTRFRTSTGSVSRNDRDAVKGMVDNHERTSLCLCSSGLLGRGLRR